LSTQISSWSTSLRMGRCIRWRFLGDMFHQKAIEVRRSG